MSKGPFIDNLSVWDLSYLEAGGGQTVLGTVNLLVTGTTTITGVMTVTGSVSATGTVTVTVSAAAAIEGQVTMTATGTITAAGTLVLALSENVTVNDALFDQLVYVTLVTDSSRLRSFLQSSRSSSYLLVDGASVDDTTAHEAIARLFEHIQANDQLSSSAAFHYFTVDGAKLDDRLYLAIPTSVLEEVTASDTILNTKEQIALIASRIAVGDLPANTIIGMNSLGEVFTLNDVMYNGLLEALTGSLTGDDTLTYTLVANTVNTDSMELSESLLNILIQSIIESSNINMDDYNNTSSIFKDNEIKELMNIGTIYNIYNNIYTCVMNPENYAVSNYSWGFTESAFFNNDYLHADDTGLYVLGGSTDDGENIVSTITTASMDFGADSLKQVPQVLLGTNGTDVILKVSIDGKNSALYELSNQTPLLDTKRFKVGKGLIGTNWQFSLITNNNSNLDLDSFEFYPVVLKRKHNG